VKGNLNFKKYTFLGNIFPLPKTGCRLSSIFQFGRMTFWSVDFSTRSKVIQEQDFQAVSPQPQLCSVPQEALVQLILVC
jgi:hypothetical protein